MGKTVVLVLSIVLTFSLLANAFLFLEINNLQNTRIILLAQTELDSKYEDAQYARYYYDLASEYYDIDEYDLLIENCQESRKYSTNYIQALKFAKARASKGNGEIIKVYVEMLVYGEGIYSNLYEACEYFESAGRAYDNDNYPFGESNIESHNEKIKAHDEAVHGYNDKLAEFTVLLEAI